MSASLQSPAPPPSSQGDGGVRVISLRGRGRWRAALYLGMAVAMLAAAVWTLWPGPRQGQVEALQAMRPMPETPAQAGPESRSVVPPIMRRPQARTPNPVEEPPELASLDPDDLAAWVRPGDPEPSMAEVIQALREAGIHDGIAAFNPPGTRPALEGIVVPEDFELPPGYVRHHQVTDEGEVIEPILMFSPDYEFMDANGRPIPLPEDGVVPPELAPPGLPIRRVRIPSP